MATKERDKRVEPDDPSTTDHDTYTDRDTFTDHDTYTDDLSISDRDTFTVVFNDCSTGLGIKIIGGLGEEEGDQDYGIFIRKVLPGGLAHQQGQLQEGDQLLSVNDQSLLNITNDGAVQILRDASAANFVKLVASRDEPAKEEYDDLLQAYSYSSASSVCERHSISSRGSLLSPTGTASRPTNGWMSPVSASLPCGPGSQAVAHHSHAQRQKCEGSSSESEPEGSSAGTGKIIPSQSPTQPSLPHYTAPHASKSSYLPSHALLLPSSHALLLPSSNAHTMTHTQPKVPNAAAASSKSRALLMAPSMASTPHHSLAYHSATSPPDGASVGFPEYSVFQPSPVLPSGSHLAHTLPKASAHGYTDSDVQDTSGSTRRHHHSRRLSLDPFVRLKIDKLQKALNYLGLDPTPEQHSDLKKRLQMDENGTVTYKEFVQVAREIFKFELEEKNFTTNSMMFALNDIKDFTDPPAFVPQAIETHDSSLEMIRCENEDLKQEIRKLKKLLREKEDELIRIRQEAHGALHESQSLRTKVHLVEQAQRAARNMEQDYEEVVRLLETEILELRQQVAKQLENPALQKRMAVLGCQLRKAEVTKKTYEVATEKLLQFAELVHDTLTGHGESLSRPESAVSHGEPARGSHPPGYLQKKHSVKTLATEARDVVRAVKSLMEVEPLPFGWEEAYTADGMKYYMNHLTQMTSWQHPLSNVQHDLPVTKTNTGKGSKGNPQLSKSRQLPSIQMSGNRKNSRTGADKS